MINSLRTNLLLLTCCGLFLISCDKGCAKKLEVPKVKHETHENNKAAPKEKVDQGITSFKHLNLEGLITTDRNSLVHLFNEEICPCGCSKSFAQCLQMEHGCKPARLLAQWAIEQVHKGAPVHYVERAITDEINRGYLASPQSIDTKNAFCKGNEKAPVIIVEFADFECPACKIAASEMKKFFKNHAAEIRICFMHFPLSAHPHAEKAAMATESAGKQWKFWEMHDLLFAYEGPLTDSAIKELAMKLFNAKQMLQFERDLTDPELLKKVRVHKEYGLTELNLAATPTFMFNGRPYHLFSSEDGYQLRLAMEKSRPEIDCQAADH
jgi:protein-disulfide isomerase